MHVHDAREFVSLALAGFLERNFANKESENPAMLDLLLARYTRFIDDPAPYWVQRKALMLIALQNQLESEMRRGLLNPDSDQATEMVIEKAKDRISSVAREEMIIRVPFPRLE